MPSRAACRLVLAGTIIALFARTATFDFVDYDDGRCIGENPPVVAGLTLTSVQWAFTNTTHFNWQPVTWLSYMAVCHFFGTRPGPHHVVNVSLHCMTVLVLFETLRLATQKTQRSFLVSLLFAIHPLHVESVAWVAERKGLLSQFFVVLALLAYVRYAQAPNRARYALVFACFALALMSKQLAAPLPVALLLFDFWPLARLAGQANPLRGWARLGLEKAPLLVLAAVNAAVAVWVQWLSMDLAPRVNWWDPVNVGLVNYVAYLGQAAWPIDLVLAYPYPRVLWSFGWGVAAGVVLLVVSALVILWRRNAPYWFTGWFWYLIMLLPMCGFVTASYHLRSDRYTDLPLLGIELALVWSSADLVNKLRLPRSIYLATAVAISALLFGLSWRQLSHWRDSFTLFERTLSVQPENAVIQNSLGILFAKSNDNERALEHFRAAARANPNYAWGRNSLGLALLRAGNRDEAALHFRAAIRNDPSLDLAYANLATVLADLGQFDAAVENLQAAIRLKPEQTVHYFNLGLVCRKRGDLENAQKYLAYATSRDPDYLDAHVQLSAVLADAGDFENAERAIDRGIELARERQMRDRLEQFQRLKTSYQDRR